MASFRSSTLFIIFTVTYTTFVDIFIDDIIIPVTPITLASRSGISPDQLKYWNSAMFASIAVSTAVGGPICGWISDRLANRRAMMLASLLLMLAGSVIQCVCTQVVALLVGRILQGLSGSITWSTPLALLADIAPKDQIGRYMGYTSIGLCAASVSAPLLGGVLLEELGYYAVWTCCFIVLAIAMVLWGLLQEPKPMQLLVGVEDGSSIGEDLDIEIDCKHAATVTYIVTSSTVDLLDYTFPVKQKSTWHDPRTWQLPTPTLVTLLIHPRLLAPLLCITLTGTILTSFDGTLAMYVLSEFHWSSIAAGAIFIPLTLPAAFGSFVGIFSDRYGSRWSAATGYLLLLPALLGLGFVATTDSTSTKVSLCVFLAIIGTAVHLTWAPLMAEITRGVDAIAEERPGIFDRKAGGAYAQAYGLFVTFYACGSAVGPLLGAALAEKRGWTIMCTVFAALAGGCAVPALLFLGGWIGNRRNRSASLEQEGGVTRAR